MAKKPFPIFFLIPIAFALFAVMAFVALNRANPNELPSAAVGKDTPTLTLTEFNGPVFTRADLADGQVKLVNFWASWCAPCRAEHPSLLALQSQGIPIYGVNYKDTPPKAQGFLAELGDPFARSAADPSGRTGLDWGLYGVPETFLIGKDGQVILRHPGPITAQILREKIAPAIAEAQK